MRVDLLFAAVLAGFSVTGALASDVRILKLPDSVIGSWAPSASACGGSNGGKISISAMQHSTADTTCGIAWITVTASRDGPVYSARSNCTRTKGGKKQPPSYLVVSPRPDNKLLLRMPTAGPNDDMVTYQKCP